MKVVTLKAEPREPCGTGGARRVRREGLLPAVIYGEGKAARHIAVDAKQFRGALDGGARVLDLDMEGVGSGRVLLKDVQWDAIGAHLVHADFLRLHADKELTLNVMLAFEGTPKGVLEGGILNVQIDALPVRCLPGNIPEGLAVPIATLGLGESIHAGDVELPENVALAIGPDDVVVTILVPRGVADDEEEAGEGEGDDAAPADSQD